MIAEALRRRLAEPRILVAPGVYDALSACQAENAGFEAAFVSGSALAAAHLGRPDVGLLTLSETAGVVGRIAERVGIPLLVDADQGFGNALGVARSVRVLEQAGAAAIQIEDQLEVKPASDPLSRPLVPLAAMLDKLAAALDARRTGALISARTDAMSSLGFDAALERAHAFAEAGADIVFIESLTRRDHMERLAGVLGQKVPLLHNLLRADDEVTDAATAQAIGFRIALFPAVAIRAAGAALTQALAQLAASPRVEAGAPPPDAIGAAAWLAANPARAGSH
jgi:2-methylisocitrate lyase-like PEP mutase family enzyme